MSPGEALDPGGDALILAITSSTARVGCAIGDRRGARAVVQATRDRRHAELLAPQIAAACVQAGCSLKDIEAVAVDVGPGLYTGLRVGVTTAVAIAHALRAPMVGVSSLDILAFGVRHASRPVAALVDARRGEVFWALYRPGPDGERQRSEPAVAEPDRAAEEIRRELLGAGSRARVLLVGDGAARCASEFGRPRDAGPVGRAAGTAGPVGRAARTAEPADGPAHWDVETAGREFTHPSAETLLLRASASVSRGQFVESSRIRPLYLRRPDARPIPTQPPRSQRHGLDRAAVDAPGRPRAAAP